MIKVGLTQHTIEADWSDISPELNDLLDKAVAISKTPAWQAHLLGLHEKERLKSERKQRIPNKRKKG